MPLYEYECEKCAHRFEKIVKFSDPPIEIVSEVWRPRAQADVVAGDSVQGHRLVHHRLREEGFGRGRQDRQDRRRADTSTEPKGDKTDSKAEKSNEAGIEIGLEDGNEVGQV